MIRHGTHYAASGSSHGVWVCAECYLLHPSIDSSYANVQNPPYTLTTILQVNHDFAQDQQLCSGPEATAEESGIELKNCE